LDRNAETEAEKLIKEYNIDVSKIEVPYIQ
jgi:hypothetical protein